MPKPISPKVQNAVSVKALAAEGKRMDAAAFAANKDQNAWITKSEAAALPAELRDNYEKLRASSKNHMVSYGQLKESFAAYASRAATAADKNHDGLISATEAKSLPTDLQDNYKVLAGANQAGGQTGAEVQKALKGFAKDLTLTFFGEDDSGGAAQVVYSKGPFKKIDSGNFEEVFNQAFGKGKLKSDQLIASDSYPPERHAELISLFKDYDPDMSAAADKLGELFKGATLYSVTVDTSPAFGGKAYLVAQMSDGSLVGLKGDVAGMTL